MVAGVAGGACVPSLLGAAADLNNTATAMVVPLMFFVAAWSYALCVNFVPAYRDVADKFSTAEVGVVNSELVGDEEKGNGVDGVFEKGQVQQRE